MVSCGSWGQLKGLLQLPLAANGFVDSLNQDSGLGKCGLHTWGVKCGDIREAAEKRERGERLVNGKSLIA